MDEEYGQYFCYPFKVTAKETGLIGHLVEGLSWASVLLRKPDDSRRALRIYDPSCGAHYNIYVDNLGVISHCEADARRRLEGLIVSLDLVRPYRDIWR